MSKFSPIKLIVFLSTSTFDGYNTPVKLNGSFNTISKSLSFNIDIDLGSTTIGKSLVFIFITPTI